MCLRGIRPHFKVPLSTLTIICSRESIEQVHWFKKILSNYKELESTNIQILKDLRPGLQELTPCTTSERTEGGWDFEDYDRLSSGLNYVLRALREQNNHQKKVRDKDIMIDITGGQKPTSVAAAAITFNRKVKMQYVQTNKPWNVVSYDVIYINDED